MRLGIVTIPRLLPPGGGSMTECLVSFAQQVVTLDFHGLWLTDAFGRGSTTLDPLSAMGVLCAVTKKVELGNSVSHLRCQSATRSSSTHRRSNHQPELRWPVPVRCQVPGLDQS